LSGVSQSSDEVPNKHKSRKWYTKRLLRCVTVKTVDTDLLSTGSSPNTYETLPSPGWAVICHVKIVPTDSTTRSSRAAYPLICVLRSLGSRSGYTNSSFYCDKAPRWITSIATGFCRLCIVDSVHAFPLVDTWALDVKTPLRSVTLQVAYRSVQQCSRQTGSRMKGRRSNPGTSLLYSADTSGGQ